MIANPYLDAAKDLSNRLLWMNSTMDPVFNRAITLLERAGHDLQRRSLLAEAESMGLIEHAPQDLYDLVNQPADDEERAAHIAALAEEERIGDFANDPDYEELSQS